mmetsp:Transcript_18530/g.29952  ORF Transcript_18530/g.29952 Transcript_18530/m.29952 type:complete len:447 (+) Transcript_18530:268-1608(+)
MYSVLKSALLCGMHSSTGATSTILRVVLRSCLHHSRRSQNSHMASTEYSAGGVEQVVRTTATPRAAAGRRDPASRAAAPRCAGVGARGRRRPILLLPERPAALGRAHARRDEEGQLQGLVGVQPGVGVRARRVVLRVVHHLVHAAPHALGHVLAREHERRAPRVAAHPPVHVEERPQLRAQVLEGDRAQAVDRPRVRVHRVAHPHHRAPVLLRGPHQRRQPLAQRGRAHPRDGRHAPGRVPRVQRVQHPDEGLRRDLRAHLDGHGVGYPAQVLHHGAPALAHLPVGHPEQVGAAGVPAPRGGVLAAKRGLVGQRLGRHGVARVEGGLREGCRPRVHAHGLQEQQRVLHLLGQRAVPRPGPPLLVVGLLQEVQVPGVQPVDVRVAPAREGAQEVQRLRRLVVRLHQPAGVPPPGLGSEGLPVDQVPVEGGEGRAALLLHLGLRQGRE